MRSTQHARNFGKPVLSLAIILVGCASNAKIMYDYDRNADFGSYHTYNIMKGAGPNCQVVAQCP